MLDTILMLASGEAETSKTPFYVAGLALTGWAVLVSLIGLNRKEFPSSDGGARGVMAITVVLVGATMATSIATG